MVITTQMEARASAQKCRAPATSAGGRRYDKLTMELFNNTNGFRFDVMRPAKMDPRPVQAASEQAHDVSSADSL